MSNEMVKMKINLEQFDFNENEIIYEILEQRADYIKTRSVYPNGLILTFEQTAEGVSLDSNWAFRQESDGSLTPVPK